MVACGACGCTNRSENGYKMLQVPANLERRKLWLENMGRINWFNPKTIRICEVHFTNDCWLEANSGDKKLTRMAVPTIFSFTKSPHLRKPPTPNKKPAGTPTALFTYISPSYTSRPRPIFPGMNPTSKPSTSQVFLDSGAGKKAFFSEGKHLNGKENGSSITGSDLQSFSLSDSPVKNASSSILRRRLKEMRLKQARLLKKAKISRQRLGSCRNKIKILEKQLRESNEKLSKDYHKSLLKKILNDDQIEALMRKTMKGKEWTNETIMLALKLKFSCGSNGYENLLKIFPLPSVRTLTRRLENLNFESGVLGEIFEFLSIKISQFTAQEKDCVLVIDEMAISSGRIYDTALKRYLGEVTLPNHSGQATDVLVIMLAGISTRWKQTVAYFFTNKKTDGASYRPIIDDIVNRAEGLGLTVWAVTSDMGSSNQALWREWGIVANAKGEIMNFTAHPADKKRKLFVLADVPHLFKNIKNMLCNNLFITMNEDVVNNNNLPTAVVSVEHLKELINFQASFNLKLAPKLTINDLNADHFTKMKVSTSTNVICHDTSSGLKYMAEELKKPEYLTTAWFIDIVDKWFHLMSSRNPVFALSKKNESVYNKSIKFLEDFLSIFSTLKVGDKGVWKPSQTGVILSTTSILQLQEIFLSEKMYVFFLTSRFTQDCLENLFSTLRSKQNKPNPVQVRNNLKLITVSQFMKNPSKSSYDEDENEYLSGFLTMLKNKSSVEEDTFPSSSSEVVLPDLPEDFDNRIIKQSELNSLYNVGGYLCTSVCKLVKCNECKDMLGSNIYDPKIKEAKLTSLKKYRRGKLFFPNKELFEFLIKIEKVFLFYSPHLLRVNFDISGFLFSISKKLIPSNLSLSCHNLPKRILKRFINFRLKINSKKNVTAKIYSSKSFK